MPVLVAILGASGLFLLALGSRRRHLQDVLIAFSLWALAAGILRGLPTVVVLAAAVILIALVTVVDHRREEREEEERKRVGRIFR